MEFLHWAVNFVLHIDRHLVEMLALYGAWIYGILFLVIFADGQTNLACTSERAFLYAFSDLRQVTLGRFQEL